MATSKAEKTRQFIIEKAAPLYNTRGIAGTAVADVMKATKMSRGSLYVHFENMEELSHCVVDYNLQLFLKRAMAVMGKQTTAKGKFFALLDHLSNPLNPPVKGGCPMMNFGMEADDTSPIVREKVNQTICGVQQAIADLITQGIKSGEFRRNWDAKKFATKAYAMIEGGILITRVSGDISQMKLLIGLLKEEIEANSK